MQMHFLVCEHPRKAKAVFAFASDKDLVHSPVHPPAHERARARARARTRVRAHKGERARTNARVDIHR